MAIILGNCCHANLQTSKRHIANVPAAECKGKCIPLRELSCSATAPPDKFATTCQRQSQGGCLQSAEVGVVRPSEPLGGGQQSAGVGVVCASEIPTRSSPTTRQSQQLPAGCCQQGAEEGGRQVWKEGGMEGENGRVQEGNWKLGKG
jgi:hypothetical protein